MPLIQRDPKDLLQQATKYGDAITAFCIVQSITFAVTCGTSDRFAENVKNNAPLVLALLFGAVVIYVLSLRRCHTVEDSIAGKPDTSDVGTAVRSLRRIRYLFVALASLLSLGMVFMAYFTHPTYSQPLQRPNIP